MRRFSSEGSLLDLDFLPCKKISLKDFNNQLKQESVPCTRYCKKDQDSSISFVVPTIQEPDPDPDPGPGPGPGPDPGLGPGPDPGPRPGSPVPTRMKRELSISAQNLVDSSLLSVCPISEGFRAYSDGQLGPAVEESENLRSRSPSPASCNPFTIKSQNRHHHHHHHHHHRDKLSAAKQHLKSLFGQAPHSASSSPTSTEPRDSSADRRSRLLFMHQWSQVGHIKKKFSKDELEKWAESLDALLASQNGVAVFEAFLRSEFSEENLLFYIACEQYKNSSTNFSLQRRAKHIYITYIQPGAAREVNLDSKTRALTMQLLQAPSHASLSHAQKRIYSLLDLDCYPRFLQSDMYLSLLHVPSNSM